MSESTEVIMKNSHGEKYLYKVGHEPTKTKLKVTDEPYTDLKQIMIDLMKFSANSQWSMLSYKVLDKTYNLNYIINKIEATIHSKNK